jgi:hypothetical protein
MECVSGVCEPIPTVTGECWRDLDCVNDQTCEGEHVCACPSVCDSLDQPGVCATPACCNPGTCGKGSECVGTACKPLPKPGLCWSDADCGSLGKGAYCDGESVCACAALCLLPDTVGTCLLPSLCPAQEPVAGTDCTNDPTLDCEYGDDIRMDCRDHAICDNGKWAVTAAKCSSPGAGELGCPSAPDGDGTKCLTAGQDCDTGKGYICACGLCTTAICPFAPIPVPTQTYTCRPPPDAPCPPYAPNLGQPCSVSKDILCDYGFCQDTTGTARRCLNGVWTDEGQICIQ